jgi:outer membrane protein TolC
MYRKLVVRQLDVAEYQVRATITQAYLAVLISERSVELIEDNLQNVEDLLKETQALYESGFAEQLDVDRLQLSRENLATELDGVVRGIIIAENLLKFQMGFPVSEDIVLTDKFDVLADRLVVEGADLESGIDYMARPEYRALLMSEDLNAINEKVIKAGYMPSFSFRAGYNQTLNRNELLNSDELGFFGSSFLGVNMSMPIFDGLERRAKLDRAKVSTEQAQIQRENFENSMTMEVRNSRIRYTNAAETVRARRRSMDLAQSIYQTTQIKYREGVGSSVERTQAESELYTAQSNYINALYDLLVAKTDLDIALGKM